MRHRATPRFWRNYNALPDEVRQLADRCHEQLRQDPHHPSLQLKKVGRFRSVRIGLHYRALALEVQTESDIDLVWFWIGSHAEYDRLINST